MWGRAKRAPHDATRSNAVWRSEGSKHTRLILDGVRELMTVHR